MAASAQEIDARMNSMSSANAATLKKSYHGVAARLDRLPASKIHTKILFIIGGVVFCDCLDMNIGGPIMAQLLTEGWSTTDKNALMQSMTMFGYLIGGLLSGVIADKFGRRKGIITTVAVFSVASTLGAFSTNMEMLTALRFVMGLGLGSAFPAGYGAFSEYTPPANRGRWQAWLGLIANSATPVATLISLIVLPLAGWRALFVLCGVFALIAMFFVVKFLPESPRWLAQKGRNDEAEVIVANFEQKYYDRGIDLPEVDVAEIEREAQKAEVKPLPWRFLFTKKMLPRTLTAAFLQFTNFTVVYTIITWTPTIFVMRGFDVTYSVGMTVVMLLGIPCGVGLMSLLIEKWDRKKQLIVGMLISGVAGILWQMIPADQTILVMLVGFLLCMITYYWSVIVSAVYLPEPFPTQVRISGCGFGNAFGRISGILSPFWIAFFLQSDIGTLGVFLVCLGVTVFASIWTAIFAVETRKKTLEEINAGVLDSLPDQTEQNKA